MKYLLTKEAKWYRVVFFAVLFMLLPNILQSAWAAYQTHYYQTADISNFYQGLSLEAENVCQGSITQQIFSTRYVGGTKTGWAAQVIRELSVVDPKNGSSKVYDESADVFIEVIPDNINNRLAAIPVVEEGVYQWTITIVRLYLPYGVIRVDAVPVTSNTFAVINCNE